MKHTIIIPAIALAGLLFAGCGRAYKVTTTEGVYKCFHINSQGFDEAAIPTECWVKRVDSYVIPGKIIKIEEEISFD